MGAEVFYFVRTGSRTGDERINLVDGAREEVVFAANFLPGGQHVAAALTAAHHHFVDGSFGQDRGGDAAGNADAANTDKGLVGIDFNPDYVPAVLVKNHGPFCWGTDCMNAVRNAVVLEEVAMMAFHTQMLTGDRDPMPQALLDKHFLRKHGPNAYYGQRKK